MTLAATLLPLLTLLPQAPDRGLESFDVAWSTIERQHFDPTFHGVDWQAVRDELRPRAAAAQSLEELREVIREMLGRLGQSHFQLTPAEVLGTGAGGSTASPAGTLGVDLRWIEDQAIVVAVEAGSPAAAAGIVPGWRWTGIEKGGLEPLLERARKRANLPFAAAFWKEGLRALDGPIDSEALLAFEDVTGAPRELTLRRAARKGEAFDFPGLPTMFLRAHHSIVEHRGRSLGVLFFSNWFRPLEREIDEALLAMRDCDGIVLDLRGNSGGDGTLTTDVAEHFFAEEASLGTMRMRHGSQDFTIRPRTRFSGQEAEAFLGPLAILIDETTGSSSEVFTGGMQATGRALVFGGQSAGAALPATLTPLPNGDTLMHAIAEFVTATGRVLEGGGVEPDIRVTPTRADWAAGKDRTLEKALDWLANEPR